MRGFSAIKLVEPTSRGLADAVSAGVRAGLLVEGDQLPPIRQVARSLRLSPTTVSAAWHLLQRAGIIRTDGRRGTTISPHTPAGPGRYRKALERTAVFELDLSTGLPDPALLPSIWPALRRARDSPRPTSYLDDPVLPELVEELRPTWPYQAEAFTVTDGAMDAIDLACSALLRFGDHVAVEQPCFPPLLDLLESTGAQVAGVRIDDQGPTVESLRAALSRGVAAFFFQPRAQNPTGVSLSEARAAALAETLSGTNVLLIEDDSAGAIASSAAISLGRWLPEQTVHIRSFSKSHGPDLRLAAMSGSARHVDAVTERRFLGQGWTSRLLQAVLLDLLRHRTAQQQVERARAVYAQRRSRIVDALASRGVTVGGSDGLNVWLPVRDESAALVRLASRGIGAAAGSPFAVLPGDTPHLRLTTGLLAEHHDVVDDIADAARAGPWASPR